MIRRRFLHSLGLSPLAAGGFFQKQPRYDILIRNGEVLDPARRFRRRADVAILDGKIAALGASMPAELGLDVIDARGLYVAPGLVDLHTHCCHGMTALGIEAD